MILPVFHKVNNCMKRIFTVNVSLAVILVAVVLISGLSSAYAHKDVFVGPYHIEVGWRDEPPLVSQQNAIVFAITEDSESGVKTGVTNAFRDLTATVNSGSVSKQLDILSEPKAGHYYSKIIPTKMGSLVIEIKGTINGVPVDEKVAIEDVEDINLLAFPPTSASGLPDLAQLKNAMSSLQQDVAEIKAGGVVTGGADPKSYDYAIFAMGIGVAGVVLAVAALIKRK